MKKIYFCVVIALTAWTTRAQFPGHNIEMFRDTEIKVNEIEENLQQFGYKEFYTAEDLSYNSVYYASPSLTTPYEYLVGQVFKVLDVVPYKDSYFDGYKIKLENPKIGVLYYKYRPESESAFVFTFVKGLKLPPDYYCKQLEKKFNKKNAETSLTSPYEDGISFVKVTDKNAGRIYLAASVNGATLTTGVKGLKLTFENGQVLNRPDAKITIDANRSSYTYSAFITLTPEDIKLLSESDLKEITTGIHSNPVSQGTKIRGYLSCLTK